MLFVLINLNLMGQKLVSSVINTQPEADVATVWHDIRPGIALVPTSLENDEDPATGIGELLSLACVFSVLRAFYKADQVKMIESRRWKTPGFNPEGINSYIILGSCHSNELAAVKFGKEGENPYFKHLDNNKRLHAVKCHQNDVWHATKFNSDDFNPNSITSDFGVIIWRRG